MADYITIIISDVLLGNLKTCLLMKTQSSVRSCVEPSTAALRPRWLRRSGWTVRRAAAVLAPVTAARPGWPRLGAWSFLMGATRVPGFRSVLSRFRKFSHSEFARSFIMSERCTSSGSFL